MTPSLEALRKLAEELLVRDWRMPINDWIDATSPDVVLALIARVERAEAEVKAHRLDISGDEWHARATRAEAKLAEAVAVLREVAWRGEMYDCSTCGATTSRCLTCGTCCYHGRVHALDCPLAAAIAGGGT